MIAGAQCGSVPYWAPVVFAVQRKHLARVIDQGASVIIAGIVYRDRCPFPPQSDQNSGSDVQQFPSHPVPFPVISDDNRTKSETNQRGIGGEGGERLGEDLRRVDIHMAMPFLIISR